jgi:hypothetical protein
VGQKKEISFIQAMHEKGYLKMSMTSCKGQLIFSFQPFSLFSHFLFSTIGISA